MSLMRPCEPGTYRCATFDCPEWAVVVEHVPVQPNGMAASVAFYGSCPRHARREPTPESVATDYRRMAASAREHGRDLWAEHWEGRAADVEVSRKITLTPDERRLARLEQPTTLPEFLRVVSELAA